MIDEVDCAYNKQQCTHYLNDQEIETTGSISEKREHLAVNYFKNKVLDLQIKSLGQSGIKTDTALEADLADIELPKQELFEICRTLNCSLYQFLTTCYLILLGKLTDKKEVNTEIPLANRRSQERFAHGCFVNTLPLFETLDSNESFGELLKKTAADLNMLLRYQNFDFQRHAEEIFSVKRSDISEMNNSITFYKKKIVFHLADTDVQNISLPYRALMLPLALEVEDVEDGLVAHFQTSENYSAQKIAAAFKELISSVLKNWNVKIGDLNITDDSTVKRIISKQNNGENIKHETVVQHFSAMVNKYGKRIAVKSDNQVITYEELDSVSNVIANQLLKLNYREIVVSVTPSINLIALILGIFKAGKIYVPLDKNMPSARKRLIYEQLSNCFTVSDYSDDIFKGETTTDLANLIRSGKTDNVNHCKPEAIAYILFTSGSTGQPKGVEVPQEALNGLSDSLTSDIKLQSGFKGILFHSYGFDYSMLEIFWPLTSGGTLYIVPEKIKSFPDLFRKFLFDNDINLLTQTPSAFLSLQRYEIHQKDRLPSLECIILGAESIKFSDLKPWFTKYSFKKPAIYNMYGVTEAACASTGHLVSELDVKKSEMNNIGGPIKNSVTIVMDAEGKPILPGFMGEVYILGNTVADGYYKNKEATEKNFTNIDGLKCFKTRDMVRLRTNGEYEYLTRSDKQVKISGHRIETGEIEKAIEGFRGCVESHVVVHAFTENDRRLVAYYVTDDFVDKKQLLYHLKTILSDYMVPSFLVEIEQFPLNTNGKIDDNALPTTDIEMSANNIVEDISLDQSTQSQVLRIWKDVLNKNDIKADDNFFDVGGTSVLISEVYYRILDVFNLKDSDISMIDLFSYSTPKDVSQLIDSL